MNATTVSAPKKNILQFVSRVDLFMGYSADNRSGAGDGEGEKRVKKSAHTHTHTHYTILFHIVCKEKFVLFSWMNR